MKKTAEKITKKYAQALVEYGLILALAAIIAVAVLTKLGGAITEAGNKAGNTVSGVSNNASNNYCTGIGCNGYNAETGECSGCLSSE